MGIIETRFHLCLYPKLLASKSHSRLHKEFNSLLSQCESERRKPPLVRGPTPDIKGRQALSA